MALLLEVDTAIRGDHAEVRARGELDMASAHVLRDAIDVCALTDPTVADVDVDLREISFCDAVGVAAILDGSASTRMSGGQLVIWPSRQVRLALDATGVADLFEDRVDRGRGRSLAMASWNPTDRRNR